MGVDCVRVFGKNDNVLAVDQDEVDITKFADVDSAAGDFCPDVIINCAAYTQVDACETHRQAAWDVNVNGPKNLALCAAQRGIALIHVSTDYVFDGSKRPPESYTEEDAPNPISYYGKTKREGEVAVERTCESYAIVRTSWLYGQHGQNILKTFLRLALKEPGKEIKVVDDQFGSPTWSYRLAQQLAALIKSLTASGIKSGGGGIYHATSEGWCTWYDLAGYFLDRMAVPHRVTACSTEQYPTPATRPKNSILENRRLKKQGINLMRNWTDDLDAFIGQCKVDLMNEVEQLVRS